MTLTEFLHARIAEDEAVARDAGPARWEMGYIRAGTPGRWLGIEAHIVFDATIEDAIATSSGVAPVGAEIARAFSSRTIDHIGRHDPARVLAECEAKRRIVELADEATGLDAQVDGEFRVEPRNEAVEPYVGDLILRALALPYANHRDHKPEWKP